MRAKLIIAIPLLTATAFASYIGAALAAGESHAHIGHVISGWKGTPDDKGLLPTALAEAEIAAKHAGLGAADLDSLESMKLHAGHVLHAIDASTTAKGPGLGYGLLKASNGTVKHITLASESSDASAGVKTHTTHVVTSSNNVIERAMQAIIEADAIISSTTAAEAAPHATKLAEITQQILKGHDANGDGKVSWQKGEGGLYVADKHMGFILDGEGLKR